jgi:peptidoglycan/LPS O-acetylase OafA/YrhL
MATAPNASLGTLQAGRAIAALAVVGHHGEQAVRAFVGPLPSGVAAILAIGDLGVDFFFVLSGFIIYYTNHARVERPGWTRYYLDSRLSRIYLPYLPIGIGIALAYTLLPGLGQGERPWNWFSTLTLLPSQGPPALSVAWTLQHEIIFYALAWLFLRTRHVLVGSLVWAALIVGWNVVFGMTSFIPLRLINLEFLFGVGAAWLFVRHRLPGSLLLLAAGAALIAGFLIAGAPRPWSFVFGLGLASLICIAVKAEVAGRLRTPALLLLLGNASYAIYLVHLPFQNVAIRGLARVRLDPSLAIVLLFVLSTLAGLAYHLAYEKPALRIFRNRFSGSRRKDSGPRGPAPPQA